MYITRKSCNMATTPVQDHPAKPNNIIDQFNRLWSNLILDFNKLDRYNYPAHTENEEYTLIEAPPLRSTEDKTFAITMNGELYDLYKRQVVKIPQLVNGLKIIQLSSPFVLCSDNQVYDLYYGRTYTLKILIRHNDGIKLIHSSGNGLRMLTRSNIWINENLREMGSAIISPISCDQLPTSDQVLLIRRGYIVSIIGLFSCYHPCLNRLTRDSIVIDIVSYRHNDEIITYVILDNGMIYKRIVHVHDNHLDPLPPCGGNNDGWCRDLRLEELGRESKWIKMIEFEWNIVGIHNHRGEVFVFSGVGSLAQIDLPPECFAVIENSRTRKSAKNVAELNEGVEKE